MLDTTLFNFIHALAGKSGFFDAAGVFFAEYVSYFVVIAALIFLFASKQEWRERFTNTAFLMLSLVLARGILTPLLKFFVDRPRPYEALSFSPLLSSLDSAAFPSGHATFFFALGMAIFLILRSTGWWFLGAAFLIGLARVFVGVHWPIDIVAGALIGIASALFVKEILKSKTVIGK